MTTYWLAYSDQNVAEVRAEIDVVLDADGGDVTGRAQQGASTSGRTHRRNRSSPRTPCSTTIRSARGNC